jgi:ABC-2 type transport system ATP-binding protein
VVSSLSGGQRRRLDIAMGLIHAPTLLFLDEPSTGLDPQNRANLLEHIRRLRAEHDTTIVLTTHYLDEADAIAERVIIVDHGKLIADDTPTRLKADHAGDRIVLQFDREDDARRAATESLGVVSGADIEQVAATVTINADGGTHVVPKLMRRLDEAGVTVTSVEVARPTLDDVFLNLTGRSLREDGAATTSSIDQERAA